MHFDAPLQARRPATSVHSRARNIPELLVKRAGATPGRRAWRHKDSGRWVSTTWREFEERAFAVATWLTERGFAPGDKVVIVGSTRPEWCIADVGSQAAGGISVGAYPTLSAEQLGYVVRHADAVVAFVEGAAELDKLREVAQSLPALRHIVVWESAVVVPEGLPPITPWHEVVATAADSESVHARIQAIEPADCAILVYTSGTTGPPKGAMISHANVLAMLRAFSQAIGLDHEDEALSFLPMAHVAERIASFYTRIDTGAATAYASSIPAVLEEVREVRPTLFGSVPRIFEKAYARIQGEVDRAPPVRRRIFRWAEGVGRRVVRAWQAGEAVEWSVRLQYRLADRLVFSRIREVFGGRVRLFMTGAAPISREILEFFWAAGFPIFEGYGMTEATAITHANRPGATRLGSVGHAFDCVEHRLAEDGEILVRGPLVFIGYYKDEDATRDTIDAEGWLHTGDVGRLDDDGYLYIVDRKKHIIITAGGKNLTPANIEAAIKTEDPLISQVHAHGDRRPYVTALITLGPLDALEWAERTGLVDASAAGAMRQVLMENPLSRPAGLDALMGAVADRPQIRERVVAAVQRGNAKLSRVERVKRVVLLERELSVEEDEITPTMKAKRRNIEKKFADRFDRLYAAEDYGLRVEQR